MTRLIDGVQDYNLYNRLARVTNFTFGTTGPGAARVSSQSVQIELPDETLARAKYQGNVSFTSDRQLEQLKQKFRTDAMGLIESAFKKAAEHYKTEFPDEKEIEFKVNMDSALEDVEYINYSMYNPVRRGFFRLTVLANIKEK